jgi:hypothetical protein
VVAVICVVCFLIRSLVQGAMAYLQSSTNTQIESLLATAGYFVAYSILYPVIAEVFPLSLLMYFMGVAERTDSGSNVALFVAPDQPAQLERQRIYSKTPAMGSPDFHGSGLNSSVAGSSAPYRSM